METGNNAHSDAGAKHQQRGLDIYSAEAYLDSTYDRHKNEQLAALYDERFHEEIGRHPNLCKPWVEHINLLKSLRHPDGYGRVYRVRDICTLEKVNQTERKRSDPDTPDDITNRILNTYERAVKRVPLSYKVWFGYIKDSIEAIQKPFYGDPISHMRINTIFERCLVHVYAAPAIYILYGQFLRTQNMITRTRKTYDRALLNLPITQHHLIWDQYLQFVKHVDILPMAKAVLKRYIQLKPNTRETLYQILKRHKQYDEACVVLCELLNDGNFVSESGKTQYDLWLELCQLIRDNPHQIKTIPIDAIIKEGIGKYSDQVAQLWIILADIHILRGQMHNARDVYEEALKSVTTVQDFSTIFDVYAKFLEKYAKERKKIKKNDIDVVITVDRLENLINNRATLLAKVKLKQNVHNVYNWLHYAKLMENDVQRTKQIFQEAVETVDPKRSVGRVTELWTTYASYFENRDDITTADQIYEKGVEGNFKFVDDLASVWCAWVEMHIRHNNFKRALELARQAVDVRNKKEPNYVQQRLYRSVKLWSLCLDLEQNLGTIATARATFDLMVELKVVTPQIALNFAMYLEDNKYFEAAFSAFEKCVALFKWPQLYYLYLPYLTKFVKRYRGTKLERAREIFDQCLHSGQDSKNKDIPPQYVKYLYFLYANMEEEFGLVRRCLGILKDATKCAAKEDQLTMIKLYIAKTTEFYGIVQTRNIYQECLQFVDDDNARKLCEMYIQMERGLGEIDRARAIYTYCAQLCDPAKHEQFWKDWREFEVLHGNEECFREMLRIKRTIQAKFTKVHFNTEEIEMEN
ncbi:Pre-mRNA-splicing factor SYF1 [Babesia sp. Xinjiang]|uniref:Pre-mRNA-splicing factor SYF1 n=1 Tax=Babesia sp. Xinjiang TaxID=462227 RepID=UPI000A22AF8B|nr:Pre-mRNA-splicing factor SYF1 [Babesia sp. Xinjiang]ORM40438.1 Pre-mRNA-splicing factor SYF1 [Babesia sp. Xinjiang]